ncbi:MAG: diguanylate cyclase, partial [Gammaproteobacteria bacterium]|nr:diguanylate cyclase [Gammaproteobacteria bacterium]
MLNAHDDLRKTEQDKSQPLILVADDDPTVRELAKSALGLSGFAVAEAVDGLQAVTAFTKLRPDLVLCDVMMPGLDGFSVCSALRELPEGEHVPVVMLTGLEDTDSIEKAYSAGATEFVVKPVNWLLLPRRIRYILRANRALRDLKNSEERYALAAKGANDGLWDWDLSNNKVHLSPRWKAMLGYSEDDIGDDPQEWLGKIHIDDVGRVRADISEHLAGKTSTLESEYRILAKDGKYLWMASRGLAVRDSNGRAYRMTGSQTDISTRKQVETQLRYNALHDALTGLPNRALFLDRLTHCIERGSRQKDFQFAVLFMDLDRFKVVNDSLGHVLGDRLLVEVGQRIKGALRSGDTLARLGGDEFTVLFEEVKEFADVTRMVERIKKRVSSPLDLDGHEI